MSDLPAGQDLSGTVLAGKFRLISKLGEGGMSTVWKAENTLVHKTVAIKLMHPEYARNPRTLDRFRNEATSAGRIGEAHICDILDFGQSELGPFIVMEMLTGESFAELLERCGRIDPGLAVMLIRQGLLGLSAAHKAGIIHRDLKPENLFLHYPEPGHLVVKLMDFGISKFTEEMGGGKTGANVLMGTPEYMSPEQAEGAANVDERTDVWAMGVMLYRAISGRDPFRGATLAATLLAVTTKDPPPLEQVVPGLPPGLAAIVQACISKSVDARYASSDALSDALRPFEAPPGTLPPPEGGEAAAAVGSPTLPSTAQAAPSLPTFSSANQQLEMARAASLAGEQGPAPAVSTSTAIASPPSAAAGVPPDGPPVGVAAPAASTWSNELAGPAGADESWTMGDAVGRPHRRSKGGSGGLILLLVLGVFALAGGGYAFFFHGPGAAMIGKGADPVGGTDATAGGETGDATDAQTGAGTDAAETGTGAGTGAESESGGDAATGDGATDDGETGAGTDAGTDADTDEGSTEAAGGDGDKPDGGSTKPKIDRRKVFSVGGLYTPKIAAGRMSYTSAMGHCRKLRKQRFAGLRRWRAAKVKEIVRFRATGVSKTLYWSVEQSGAKAKAVNMLSDRMMVLEPGSRKPRAFCVSSG